MKVLPKVQHSQQYRQLVREHRIPLARESAQLQRNHTTLIK